MAWNDPLEPENDEQLLGRMAFDSLTDAQAFRYAPPYVLAPQVDAYTKALAAFTREVMAVSRRKRRRLLGGR